MDLYYYAADNDGGCITRCFHYHQTMASAVACIQVAGGYVVAVENGKERDLTEQEETQFQEAMYGLGSKGSGVVWNGLAGWILA